MIPWSPCPAEHHHSPSDIPSTACLSPGLLGFCLDAGNQLLVCCFGAREGLCYLQPPPGWAELLGSEELQGSSCSSSLPPSLWQIQCRLGLSAAPSPGP